jgi:hypothetical protein
MDISHLRAAIDHHHRIGLAPFLGGPPDPGDCEDLFARERVPGSGHRTLGAFGFGPGADRDQAAAALETRPPERGAELGLARVVDRLGLQHLSALALERERKTLGATRASPSATTSPGYPG